MKNTFKILFTLVLIFCLIPLVSCDNETITNGNSTTEATQLDLSDYTLPENFFMTIEISDTSIFDKGDPWYYKTAKIANDWELIEYNRDLDDLTKQKTHFFKYISDDLYQHYLYNYVDQSWDEVDMLSFHEMVFTTPNNFKFLYKKPTEVQYNIVETAISYDCDPTSIESLREAIMYEYTYGLDKEIIVDSKYLDIMLSEVQRDESRICTSCFAYEFNLTISSWSSTYLGYKNFKDFNL